MKCTRIGEKRCNGSCFEIDQEMDAILLIIGIVYGVCRIVIFKWWFTWNNSFYKYSSSLFYKDTYIKDQPSHQARFHWLIDWCFWCLMHFQQYFSYIMATSFSGGRSQSTRREPSTMGKQLVNSITYGCESSAPFFVIYKARW